jgi:hypothetical protein
MTRYKATVNGNVPFTAEEETQWDKLQADAITNAPKRKLQIIKNIRLQKLQETDWWVISEQITDSQKTWRQNLRNLPQDFSTEEEYDLLLARETDKTKDNFGELTHAVWSKP